MEDNSFFILTKFNSLKDKGFFHLIIAMFFGQGFAFAQKILLGRWLSQESFGRFSLIVETNILIALLMTLALPNAMIRYGLREKRLEYYMAGTFRVFVVLCALIVMGYYVLRWKWKVFDDPVTMYFIDFAVLVAPSFALFNFIVSYLSAAKRAKERAVVVLVQRIVYFVAIVGGCWTALWIGTIVGYFVFAVLFGLFLYGRFRRVIHKRITNFPYGKLLGFASWNSLGQIGVTLSVFLIYNFSERILEDLVLISELSIAFAFTVIAKIFFASIYDIFFPYFSEKNTGREFRHLFYKVVFLYLCLSIVVMAVSYGIVPFLIDLLLDQKYAEAIPIFKILIIGETIVGFSFLLEMILEIFGVVRFKAFGIGVTVLVLLLVLTPLLRNYGIFGAAYAFLVFSVMRTSFNLVGVIACLFFRSDRYLA